MCLALAVHLSESEWLSNKSNALRILVWCVGSSYLATTFAVSVERYVLGSVSSDAIRRIRLMMADEEQFFVFVPGSLLSLVSTLSLGPCTLHPPPPP